MADEEKKDEEKKDEEEGSQEEAPKKKNPMMLIIIGAVAVLLIVIIVVLLMVMGGEEEPPPDEASGSAKKSVSKQIKDDAKAKLGPVVPLKQFIVNLVSNNGRRYLKVEMQLELSGEELMEEAVNKQPMARDIIIRTLSSKTYEEISTEQGKTRLKEEILGNLNAKIVDGEIVNVFFTKFVVQ